MGNKCSLPLVSIIFHYFQGQAGNFSQLLPTNALLDWLTLTARSSPYAQEASLLFYCIKKSKCQSKKNTRLLFIFIWISKYHANSKAINSVLIQDLNDLKNDMLRKLLFLLRIWIKLVITLLGRNLLNLPSHLIKCGKRKSLLHHTFTTFLLWNNEYLSFTIPSPFLLWDNEYVTFTYNCVGLFLINIFVLKNQPQPKESG